MMNMLMTLTTYWNNIKTMFFVISIGMMIVFSFVPTIETYKSYEIWEATRFNGTANGHLSSFYPRVQRAVLSGAFAMLCFVFIRVFIFGRVFSLLFFVFRRLVRQINAMFAHISAPVFSAVIFVKAANRLNLLAFITSFCYNWFRHGLIPYIKSWSEPFGRYALPYGSFYYINERGVCQ